MLAKKEDIEQALASIRVVFMVWVKLLLQVENVELPRRIMKLLGEFLDVFPEELPKGLQHIYRIEHQIDLVSRASLPNRLTYWCNTNEATETQSGW
jgi:hypothetical protein